MMKGVISMLLQECERLSPAISDAVLAQRTLEGDQHAFELLVRRYQGPVFSFIHHLLKDYDLASDVSQQVFIRLYTALPTLRAGEPFKGWLFQVARHCCIDEIRRRRRQALPFSYLEAEDREGEQSPLDSIPDTQPLLDEELETRERQSLLWGAIRELPPKFRAVVALRYMFQMKFSEIGKRLGMPEPTAKTYFARAKVILRRNLRAQMDVA
jgi:RNA polymerase sigma factor (sigma-70 family)